MTKKQQNLLKISELAKEAGVLASTIRYYTDIGLLTAKLETQGGHRLYDKETCLATINKIQFLSHKGYTIEDIKKELLNNSNKKNILVIDDEPEIGGLIKDIAKDFFQNLYVQIAYDGFTAGKVLSEYIFDLIILDLMLPGLNGFDVCKQIKENRFLANSKIIVVTGYDNLENRENIYKCGVDDYLTKPLELKILIEKISQLLDIPHTPHT